MHIRDALQQCSHAQVPKRFYFTRQVSLCSHRDVIAQYRLPQRVYLGPTSMDTEMAFIMCNQAKVCCHTTSCPLISRPLLSSPAVLCATASDVLLALGTSHC